MIKREEVEIRDQQHLMDAEGCHENKPSARDIVRLLTKEGWRSRNLDIWFDETQGFWRWSCDIMRI